MLVSRLKLKVIPSSSKNEVIGWHGERLKIKVQAPPEKGKANQAVVKVLAKCLQVSLSDVVIVSGAESQHKTVEVKGIDVLLEASKLFKLS